MKNRPICCAGFLFKKRPRKMPVERFLRQGTINGRAELKQGLKRKYERLKRKAVNCDNSSTELLGKTEEKYGLD